MIHLLLFTARCFSYHKSHSSHKQSRIIVRFVLHNSLKVSLVIVFACWLTSQKGAGGEKRAGRGWRVACVEVEIVTATKKKKSLEIKLCIHGAELRILRWHHIESFLLCKVKLDILMFVAVEGAKNVNYTIEREGHAAGFVALRIKVRRES